MNLIEKNCFKTCLKLSKMSSKVIDIIKNKEFTYSIEVYSGEQPVPPFDKLDNLTTKPAFIAITWHSKLQDMNSLESMPLKIATHLRDKGKNVVLHLSCDLMKKDYMDKLLKFLKEKGLCNIFIMQGDQFDAKKSEFKYSKELIVYIRKHSTGSFFCIGVAGFPDQADDDKIKQLKDKIDSGVDFVFTQAFVEFKAYKEYVSKCERMGIKVPIIPGIFIYKDYQQLDRFNTICKIKISDHFLETFKNNKNISGVELVKKVAAELKAAGAGSNHIHFYTLNKLEEAEALIKDLQKH